MAYVQIQRDAFARQSLLRTTELGAGRCRNCGNDARFYYGWMQDAVNASVAWDGPFCSVVCYRSYQA